MNKQEMDDIFADRARQAFLASANTLDPRVLARLSAARRRAVDSIGSGRVDRLHVGWRVPASAMALAFVAVIGGALWMGGNSPDPAAAPFTTASTDAPLMMTNDNLDMYADLDFYQWMETEDEPAPAPAADTSVDDSDDDDDTGVGG